MRGFCLTALFVSALAFSRTGCCWAIASAVIFLETACGWEISMPHCFRLAFETSSRFAAVLKNCWGSIIDATTTNAAIPSNPKTPTPRWRSNRCQGTEFDASGMAVADSVLDTETGGMVSASVTWSSDPSLRSRPTSLTISAEITFWEPA